MKKIFIKNRKNQKVSVIIEKAQKQKGLIFIMHGLGGFKEQPHLEIFAEAFKEKGFTVVRFDTTNTFGESDGNYEDATLTNYYEDLEDVIKWTSTQDFYQEPFWLVGHSLGGISVAMYAENYPDKVRAVAPISPVVSGKLSKENYNPIELAKWKKTGYKEKPSVSMPGVVKKLKYNEFLDRQRYDLLPKADKLTMPVLIIVGEKDTSTPVKHQEILFKDISGNKKELHVIKDAPHTFRDKNHLQEIKGILLKWIDKYNK
ncbi:MAG TPA: alpha/beta fold hydrolase [Patescibacteria group bacterium]|nr:alpha/beta fold hydrolase [Patescibacteria group bacterium]